MRTSLRAWLTLVALATAGTAHAGRPLQTEDAGILYAGGCENEGAHERLRVSGVTERDTNLPLHCGLGWRSHTNIATSPALA